MHLPSANPRPSIYYNYQVFKPWLPTENGIQEKKKVVIVGAGPAGMVTALELARHGVASVVLASDLQFSQGSRAIVFTRRSMEILQQVGVAHRISENGLPWRCGNSIYRGQKVFRMETPLDPDDRFFPMINIQQQYLEEYLHDACAAHSLIEVRWGNKLAKAEQLAGNVTAHVDTPAGPYQLETEWLVAADGGRSEIRSAMNLKLEGASFESIFVIADIRIDLPFPTERLAYFDPDWNRGNTILMHKEPHGIWRVDYQLPLGETPEEALRPESLQQRIDAQLKMIGFEGTPWEMDWSSVYSARTLTLPDYVHNRIVFTGDAAHLLPIFGVRGANTAFQDAQSLGWHLAYVLRGIASEKLMANHSEERVGAAREIITEAGKSTRFMAPPSRGFRLLRDAVLSLSLTEEFVRPLYHWRNKIFNFKKMISCLTIWAAPSIWFMSVQMLPFPKIFATL
jgi:3-(3-hydroxy-phenyl)propionate hydroxylase